MILLSGNVTYVVEGRSYPLIPWDIVLVDRGQVHRPVVDTAQPYERILLYLSPSFLEKYSTKEASLTKCFEMCIRDRVAGLCSAGALAQQVSGFDQAFFGNVVSNCIAGFLLEKPHHVIGA